jgi:hypothetical protein
MTSTSNIPPSENLAWGFVGTIAHHTDADAAWSLAMTAIADVTGSAPDEVRAFLDSRHGRHFADDVANALFENLPVADAIATTATRWMGWTIGRATARDTGIPQGLPYLTGFVMHAAIEADATD